MTCSEGSAPAWMPRAGSVWRRTSSTAPSTGPWRMPWASPRPPPPTPPRASAGPSLDTLRSLAPDPTSLSALAGSLYVAATHAEPERFRDALELAARAPEGAAVAAVAGALLGAAHGASRLPVDLVARHELAWPLDVLARDVVAQLSDPPGGSGASGARPCGRRATRAGDHDPRRRRRTPRDHGRVAAGIRTGAPSGRELQPRHGILGPQHVRFAVVPPRLIRLRRTSSSLAHRRSSGSSPWIAATRLRRRSGVRGGGSLAARSARSRSRCRS